MDVPVAIRSDVPTRVGRMLVLLGMPPDEVQAVLTAEEPGLVRMYFELHRERLSEALADQLRLLTELERSLALEILQREARSIDRR